MQWYYAQNGQRLGPYGDAEFAQLVSGGQVAGETLVWHEGMANWQAYSQVLAAANLAQSVAGAASSATAAAAGHGDTRQLAFCTQCGRYGNTSDMIAYEGSWVCPDCKELFFQRVREGIKPAGPKLGLRYAGFWIRVVAVLIDGIAMLVVVSIIRAIAGEDVFGNFAGRASHVSLGTQIALDLVGLGIGMAYETWMIGTYGATLGKMACGLKIVRPDGQCVTYARAFGRYLARGWFGILYTIVIMFTLASVTHQGAIADGRAVPRPSDPMAYGCVLGLLALVALVGYAMAGFTDQKRALHDMICGTRVIWK